MNYLLLKGILDATLSHFVCRGCSSKTDEKSVDVAGIHDSILHIDIRCTHCGLVSSIKAEVNMVGGNTDPFDVSSNQFRKSSGSIFDSSSHSMQHKKASTGIRPDAISDEDILKLRDTLGKDLSVSDLFGSTEN